MKDTHIKMTNEEAIRKAACWEVFKNYTKNYDNKFFNGIVDMIETTVNNNLKEEKCQADTTKTKK